MNPPQATNKNFLLLTKYFNKQPKQKVIIDDTTSIAYHAVHLISTMSNKVKDSIIYISKRSSIIKLKSLILEVTKYKSIEKEYHISNVIGKGGFGTVVKGTTIKTGIPVAIKILQKDYSKREVI